ncbi:MAG: methylmalonyl-CoA epimerase [Chloroflexi bacterium]|nr:methylmalonyl-CoA epimerase [Chloroflexota bacterium]
MSICTARHINHVCIAVKDVDDTVRFYRNVFGVAEAEVVDIEDQSVRAALIRVGGSQLEFIEPTDPDGGVAKFIDRRGEGVHHICFEVEDLASTLQRLDEQGVAVVDREPREGLSGTIGFIHPKATRGVLIELVDQDDARR